jgi:hypothetical protein
VDAWVGASLKEGAPAVARSAGMRKLSNLDCHRAARPSTFPKHALLTAKRRRGQHQQCRKLARVLSAHSGHIAQLPKLGRSEGGAAVCPATVGDRPGGLGRVSPSCRTTWRAMGPRTYRSRGAPRVCQQCDIRGFGSSIDRGESLTQAIEDGRRRSDALAERVGLRAVPR